MPPSPVSFRLAALRALVDPWLHEVNPAWSLTESRARIVAIREEAEDFRTFVLAPNRHWPGHRAGQFVPVAAVVDGVRTERCYSISSAPTRLGAPARPTFEISVRRVREPRAGILSTYLHTEARVGDVLRLGRPAGDFVLPEDFQGKLLLIGGGSGITPVLSIARDLAARERLRDVVFVHAARSEAALPQAIRRELQALPFAGVHFLVGLLTPERLTEIVPDRHTYSRVYLCGPAPMMEPFVRDVGGVPSGILVTERFQADLVGPPSLSRRGEGEVTPVKVALGRGRVVAVAPTPSLLEALEAAGERPRYGCRQGICNSCRCEKRSGIVEDLRSGKRSGPHAEEIRLCTSRAVSDLELDLGDLR